MNKDDAQWFAPLCIVFFKAFAGSVVPSLCEPKGTGLLQLARRGLSWQCLIDAMGILASRQGRHPDMMDARQIGDRCRCCRLRPLCRKMTVPKQSEAACGASCIAGSGTQRIGTREIIAHTRPATASPDRKFT